MEKIELLALIDKAQLKLNHKLISNPEYLEIMNDLADKSKLCGYDEIRTKILEDVKPSIEKAEGFLTDVHSSYPNLIDKKISFEIIRDGKKSTLDDLVEKPKKKALPVYLLPSEIRENFSEHINNQDQLSYLRGHKVFKRRNRKYLAEQIENYVANVKELDAIIIYPKLKKELAEIINAPSNMVQRLLRKSSLVKKFPLGEKIYFVQSSQYDLLVNELRSEYQKHLDKIEAKSRKINEKLEDDEEDEATLSSSGADLYQKVMVAIENKNYKNPCFSKFSKLIKAAEKGKNLEIEKVFDSASRKLGLSYVGLSMAAKLCAAASKESKEKLYSFARQLYEDNTK
ncbi:hypothetical protein KY321_03585 [Candidatus Woesearchaeota archaeon]|nr:hypothetical protein [Candidatus Woesearchaeota archaeon]